MTLHRQSCGRHGHLGGIGPLIRASDVTFGYMPGQTVLSGWSASFMPGSMTAITGRSGRGKSTLLYLIGLMIRPATGDLLVMGRSTATLSDSHRADLRAKHFGFVFQDAALDQTRTVLDNVVETALYRGQPRREAVMRANVLLERFGVDVPADRRPGQVSGGQAQRIAMCRALLNAPEILLADEPTGNLDPNTSMLVVDALQEHAAGGAAVIIVTHAPEVAARCDRQLRL